MIVIGLVLMTTLHFFLMLTWDQFSCCRTFSNEKNCKCQIFWVGISLLLFIVVLLIFNCSLFLWLRTSVIFTFCNHWPIDYTCCWTMFCHKKIVLENKNFDEKYVLIVWVIFFFFKQVYKLWIFHCISRIWINIIHIWGWGLLFGLHV